MNNLDILYEDKSLLGLNKPVGVVVNRADTTRALTLQDFLCDQYSAIFEGLPKESEFYRRSGVVHRLDKDTSGVLIVAKDENSFFNLQRQFKERTVWKEYVALVVGDLRDEAFEVVAPIGRNPKNRLKFAVISPGRQATTYVEKVESRGELTFVRVWPKTGRTHQIRVHLAAMGHPVVGDRLYSTKKQLDRWGKSYNRMMLHAHKIGFLHPTTGTDFVLEATIPGDFFDTM